MVVVDSNFLSLMLHPIAKPPLDPATGQPVDRLPDRIELLIETFAEDGETMVIPTPVLSEFLVLADTDGAKYLSQINGSPLFQVAAFDERAAVELAAIHLNISASMSKRARKRHNEEDTWAKMKFDRQIVAIARVNGAATIYSDDHKLGTFAERSGITVVRTWELPLPKAKQLSLPEDTD